MTKKVQFSELNLSNDIVRALEDIGFAEAFPIQVEAIPPILEGHDVIGQAQTGTGKTAAFALPAIDKIDAESKATQVLILLPTRELAIQVSNEIKKFLKYKRGIVELPIYGGQSIDRQFQVLRRGAQIVVGTPGRIMDHLQRKTLRLESVKMVVLDEADEMLNMGFREDIETILKQVPTQRQTILFSATMSPAILRLTKQYQLEPKMIKVAREERLEPAVEQIYFDVESRMKTDLLTRLIDLHSFKLSIVFCNTKRKVDEIVASLHSRGYSAEGLHGDLTQARRNRVMSKFRSGEVSVLVATDVAARGIDVANVEAVFNYEIPMDVESYVHRIGRTGRAGKLGKAFSFIAGREAYKLRDIKRYTGMDIVQQQIPSQKALDEIRMGKMLTDIKDVMKEKDLVRYTELVEKLVKEDCSMINVAAALLRMHMNKGVTTKPVSNEDSYEDDTKPARSRSRSSERFSSRPSFGNGERSDRAPRSGSREGSRSEGSREGSRGEGSRSEGSRGEGSRSEGSRDGGRFRSRSSSNR